MVSDPLSVSCSVGSIGFLTFLSPNLHLFLSPFLSPSFSLSLYPSLPPRLSPSRFPSLPFSSSLPPSLPPTFLPFLPPSFPPLYPSHLPALSFPSSCTDFILYATIAIGLATYIILFVAPNSGQTNMLIYIAICSLFGSLSVVAAKGLSIGIRLTLGGNSQLRNPLAWLLLICLVTFITIQMNYLNKSLDTFNTSMVTPIYYVMFTSLTITSSAILFKEWTRLSKVDMFGIICGFLTVICGVFLIHWFKDVEFSFTQLLKQTKKQPSQGDTEEGIILSQKQLELGVNPPLHSLRSGLSTYGCCLEKTMVGQESDQQLHVMYSLPS